MHTPYNGREWEKTAFNGKDHSMKMGRKTEKTLSHTCKRTEGIQIKTSNEGTMWKRTIAHIVRVPQYAVQCRSSSKIAHQTNQVQI